MSASGAYEDRKHYSDPVQGQVVGQESLDPREIEARKVAGAVRQDGNAKDHPAMGGTAVVR